MTLFGHVYIHKHVHGKAHNDALDFCMVSTLPARWTDSQEYWQFLSHSKERALPAPMSMSMSMPMSLPVLESISICQRRAALVGGHSGLQMQRRFRSNDSHSRHTANNPATFEQWHHDSSGCDAIGRASVNRLCRHACRAALIDTIRSPKRPRPPNCNTACHRSDHYPCRPLFPCQRPHRRLP